VATIWVLVPIAMVGLAGVTAIDCSVGVVLPPPPVLVEPPPPPQAVNTASSGTSSQDANLNDFFMMIQFFPVSEGARHAQGASMPPV
jgi:hypothetical protein